MVRPSQLHRRHPEDTPQPLEHEEADDSVRAELRRKRISVRA